jgi:beta-lactamase class A
MPAFGLVRSRASAKEKVDIESELVKLEQRHAGRICVGMLDLATGRKVGHRGSERMLFCSTFKMLAAGFVLSRVDAKQETLDRRIVYSEQDVVESGSPVTATRFGQPGMTIGELCDAAVTRSDNTAGNLLLQSFGGPSALTAFIASIGDHVSHLDRMETALNYHDGPDDQRDTTTAFAMLDNIRKLVFGDILSRSSRSQLIAWLITNKTGDARLRAGIPDGWLVGDKTGVNDDKNGNLNDVAVLWRPDASPMIVTAYCQIPTITADQRNAVLAEIGKIATRF